MLNEEVDRPWNILYEARELKDLCLSMHCKISHIYRESNRGADFLANWGCKHQRDFLFEDGASLPRFLKGICRHDRLGFQNIRSRKW